MPWTHPARFNEYAPVRAADLNDLAADHETLLGDVARANLPISSPIWRTDLGDLYKDMAMWHRARYLWLRVTGLRVTWWLRVNGVEVVRRTWGGGSVDVTWTETIDLHVTNPNLVLGRIYNASIDYEYAGPGTDSWIHLKAIYQRESI